MEIRQFETKESFGGKIQGPSNKKYKGISERDCHQRSLMAKISGA